MNHWDDLTIEQHEASWRGKHLMELPDARRFATHLLEKNCEVDNFTIDLSDPKEMHAVRTALEELGCSVGIVSPLKHRLDVICPEGHLGKLIEGAQPDARLR